MSMKNPSSEYDRLFLQALDILNSCNDVNAVKDYIFAIEDQDYRDVTLAKIGVLLVTQNRPDDGMHFVRAIKNTMERADALLDIAREYIKRGGRLRASEMLTESASTAEDIERSTWETPSMLLQICAELRGLAFPTEALAMLRRAISFAQKGGDFDSAKVLGGGAVLLAEWGYRDEAISAANLISQAELHRAILERLSGPGQP